jgi:hypothetical protein
MKDTDQKLKDAVIKRMLETQPAPHKEKRGRAKTRPPHS